MNTTKKLCTAVAATMLMAVSGQMYAANNDSNSSMASVGQSMGQTMDDAAITTKIKTELLADSMLSPFNIKVKTTNGVVMLSGNVDSDAEFEKAVTLAEATDGVKDVNADHLTIKDSEHLMSDTLITAKVKGLLLKNNFTESNTASALKVSVETNNGVVYLTGTVENEQQAKSAASLAKSVDGVLSVKSDLKVKDSN